MKNNYHYKDNEFLLMCNQGHKFITTFKTPTVICKLSNIIKLNGKKISIDLDSTYKNPDSYIHFHCDEMRHDPHCSYYGCVALKATEVGVIEKNKLKSPRCNNYIKCNQDSMELRTGLKI